MDKAFIFGVSVSGENFTDRVKETRRIKTNFESGVNTILISPRRIGKTSLVKRVCENITDSKIKTIYIDIYDCRDEYDFYNKFAEAVLKGTSGKLESLLNDVKEFFSRISPKVTISPDFTQEYSLSLGLSPKNYRPDEILDLPEKIAEKNGIKIIVCIDEFQQIGEFADSLTVQKRLRSVWQHQKLTSYCLFGSKKHMMENLFQSRRMPFYQFGDTIHLGTISTEDWVPFIKSRFEKQGKTISDTLAAAICDKVQNYSSYVQQLSWNVLIDSEKEVSEKNIQNGVQELIAQNSALFMQQIGNLTSYQLNFIRAVCKGVHKGFSSQEVLDEHNLGSKSNIARLQNVLTNKELVEKRPEGIFLADPVFQLWFTNEYL